MTEIERPATSSSIVGNRPGSHIESGFIELGEGMKSARPGWHSRFQIVLALVLILTSIPLTSSAQVATPVTAPPPTESSTTPTPETEPAESSAPAVTSRGSAVAAEQDESAFALFVLVQCENDDRAGEVDFFPIQDAIPTAARHTSDNCGAVPADSYVEMYLIDAETDTFILIEQPEMEFPAGSYVLLAYINNSSGESVPIEFAPNSQTVVQVVSYVPDDADDEIEEGFGSVDLMLIECINWERAGEFDFLVASRMSARSATTECTVGSSTAFSFSLVNADDPSLVLPPDASDSGSASFSEVPSGTWYLSEATTGITSDPFTVSNEQQILVQGVSYVQGPIDLSIEKIFCEDNTRAGMTDFTISTHPSMFGAAAASSTCYSVPLSGQAQAISVTLDNTDTGDSYQVDLVSGSGYLESITPGTYVATESIDGLTVTSDPFTILEPGMRLQVINYVAEQTGQPEPGEGFGTISGQILYCSSPDRAEGDVDFIIQNAMAFAAVSTSECAFGAGTSGGMLLLYAANPDTGEVDEASVTPIWTDGQAFWQDIIPAGYYALGYVSPYTGETAISQPFTIAHRAETSIEINVFAAPAFTTYLDVWMEICVDPDRANQTSFQLITEEGGLTVAAEEDGTPTDCRSSNPDDGEIAYTLTNLDTGQSWSRSIVGGDSITFDNLLAGMYTLSETHNGITATSEAFILDPSIGTWHWMNIRNFIAERDWTEPEPGEDVAYIAIFAYGCANGARDGGTEWFRYAPVLDENDTLTTIAAQDLVPAPASDTSDCVTIGEGDGIGFIATPVNGEGGPYEFFESGPGLFELWDIYGIPAGDYIITELSTGATTGVVRIVGWTAFDLLMFEELPKAEVTLNVESADPAVANTLPEGSTWTITNVAYPAYTLGGTFPADDLELPVAITLDSPLPYGEYRVEVNATPAFDPYSETFTVGPMELASTRLFGLLQQPPDTQTLDIILQPAQEEPTPTPTATVTPTPTATPATPSPTTEPSPTPSGSVTPTATTTAETVVTSLPSTGSGGAGEGMLLLLASVGAVLAGAGAWIVREKRA